MKALSLLLITITLFYANIINFDTYQANFTQTVRNNSGKLIKYTGKIFIDNHSNILWRYKTPIIKNIYINKKLVIIDEPELEQAILSPLKNELNFFDLLNNSKKISKNIYNNKINGVLYKLVIKNNNLYSITYTDEIDNHIKIVFTNQQKNIHFDKNLFKFTTPAYYDVIRK